MVSPFCTSPSFTCKKWDIYSRSQSFVRVKGKNAGKCTQNDIQHIAWGQLMLALLTCRRMMPFRHIWTQIPLLYLGLTNHGLKEYILFCHCCYCLLLYCTYSLFFFSLDHKAHYSLSTVIWFPRHKTDKFPENRHMAGHKILKLERTLDMA